MRVVHQTHIYLRIQSPHTQSMPYQTFLLALLLTLSSCVYTTVHYDEQVFYVAAANNATFVSTSASAEKLETDNDSIAIWHIKFDAVQGGETLLFGRFKIREGNGYTGKRLEMLNPERTISNWISIADLQNSQVITIDSIVAIDLRRLD